jgi:predicted TIM-barrel fold metal-dependent hydrolase
VAPETPPISVCSPLEVVCHIFICIADAGRQRTSPDDMVHDQFVKGYVDLAILQPTYLTDFYKNGFNAIEQNSVMKQAYPDRYILNGAFDPREGEAGLEYLRRQKGEWGIKGVKLYTAEWRHGSKGYKLSEP